MLSLTWDPRRIEVPERLIRFRYLASNIALIIFSKLSFMFELYPETKAYKSGDQSEMGITF